MTITTASAPAGWGEKNEQPTADLWRRLKSKTSRAAQRLKVGRSTGPQKGRDLCLFGDWLLEFFINGVRYAVDGRLIEAEILTESFGRERGLFDCFFFLGCTCCLQGDTCCWSCDRCDPWEYVENEFKCADCGDGRWPYDDKRGCFDLEMQYMRWDSLMALVPVCVACVGILLTLAVIIIFIRHSETPIVKASD